MSITRSQIARQLMAEGGAPRQGYFLGKIVRKIKDDIIPNELKSPAGLAAAALAVDQFGIPGTDIGGGKKVSGFLGDVFRGISGPNVSEEMSEGSIDTTKRSDDKSFPSKIGSGIRSAFNFLGDYPELASIGAGLVAGAFSKKEDDPLYTGQSVGLNLQDIRKLANISDQKTGAAIGLNFLPDTKFRKFSPTEMAATYAANQPVDFTEQRESADEGGIMGTQKDFNKFLEEMKKRDMGRMQEQILRDYEEFMRRKRMINQMPEVKDGGRIMANKGGIMGQFKMASAPDPAADRNDFLEMMSEKYYKKPLKDLTPDEFMDLEEALDDMGMKPRDNNMKMASAVLGGEEDDIAYELFGKPYKDLTPAELEEFREEMDRLEKKFMKRDSKENMKMASAVLGGEEDDIAYALFGKPYKDLNPAELEEFREEMDRLEKKFMKRDFKKNRTMAAGGGIMNLGGMEMDLRGGGFVPIGAKEKADDVPARLSKNEFVFTADAVRAAGGGSVDKGADKMYATMKALENKVA